MAAAPASPTAERRPGAAWTRGRAQPRSPWRRGGADVTILGLSEPPPAQPPPRSLAEDRRLGRHARRRDRFRARLRGGGGETVPDPVGLDGAAASLRQAAGRVPRPHERPGAREPARLPIRAPPAGPDRRLPGPDEGE